MIILTEADVRRVFDMELAFRAVREAAIAYVSTRTVSPVRTPVAPVSDDAEFLVMPGAVDGTFATKIWYALEAGRGQVPQSSALITLIDPELDHEFVVEAGLITDLRTGAMTGLAAERLARRDAESIGVIGAGIQARTQVLALVHARPTIREVRVFSRNSDRRTSFCVALSQELEARRDVWPGASPVVAVVPVSDAEASCRDADIIVAATTSPTPVVQDEWIGGDAMVCSVGSHSPNEAELQVDTVARARRVVVDTLRGGVDGAGDIAVAIDAGHLSRGSVTELGHLLQEDPAPPAGVNVFKSVGFSATDVLAARLIARAAHDQGIGTHITLR